MLHFMVLKPAWNKMEQQWAFIIARYSMNMFTVNVNVYSKFTISVDLTEGINIYNPDKLLLSP